MKLRKACRTNIKIKMGLQGPSGGGKTYSSLLIAFGLCGDWTKIAVIDTENHSADLYDHLGEYNVIPIDAPFSPDKYISAIKVCQDSGMEVIIIDSMTHSWEYLIEYHASLQGNSFTNWGKITPMHNELVQAILQSPCHVIATIRCKQDYILVEKNNKQVPEKVGLKGVQRDGLEYDFTLVFDLDMQNHAISSKDRTGLFFQKPPTKLSIETGQLIKDWCEKVVVTEIDVKVRIEQCMSLGELLKLYNTYPQYNESLTPNFQAKKQQLATAPLRDNSINNSKANTNAGNPVISTRRHYKQPSFR